MNKIRTAQITISPGTAPDQAEVAAALAAITHMLAEEHTVPEAPAPWAWRATAALLTQGLQSSRVPVRPAWNTIERLRRVGRGGSGIIGQ